MVNVCEFDNRQDVPPHLNYHFIHVPDYGVPSEEQVDHFIKLMDKHHTAGEPVVIHCVAGCGRTGQFIIAWCARAGFISKGTDPVDWIRSKRKCCLETGAQEQCARLLTKKYSSANGSV